jgi:rhamnogalacturonyl hydrolase YesR
VGDPASLGIFALLIGQSDQNFHDAAIRQVGYLLNDAPKAWNGAISHRNDTPEVWVDFTYMAPPFLAYYAVATQNTTFLRLAIKQCDLQRQILQANLTTTSQKDMRGLWHHIIGPDSYEPRLWSTGNAWAAAGMIRVLATTLKWKESASWVQEQEELTDWIREIIDGVMKGSEISIDPQNGLLRNYLNDTTWFGEAAGTALMASVVYRMAVLVPDTFSPNSRYITFAEGLRRAVENHIDGSGTLRPVIDPLNCGTKTPFPLSSPEGQSFGVLLAAAYRYWKCSKLGGNMGKG